MMPNKLYIHEIEKVELFVPYTGEHDGVFHHKTLKITAKNGQVTEIALFSDDEAALEPINAGHGIFR